jgi:hypothetical protein
MTSNPTLPALPEPDRLWSEADDEHVDAWLAVDVLQAWGQQCFAAGVAMERERCAVLLDAYAKLGNCTDFAENMAAAIRKEPT